MRLTNAYIVMMLLAATGAVAQVPGGPPLRPGGSTEILDPYALSGEILTLEGEALVWSESETQVLVAVDESGPSGHPDGKIDHTFSFRSSQPLPDSLSFRDPSALVQVHRAQLTVILRSEGLVLNFLLEGSRNILTFADEDRFLARTFRHGLELQRYSDGPAQRATLEDVARDKSNALSPGAEESLFLDPFRPAPTDSGGSACLGSCSINKGSCAGSDNSCSTTCTSGCAYCTCDSGWPSCSCKPR